MPLPLVLGLVDVGLRVVDKVLDRLPTPDAALRRQREAHAAERRLLRMRQRQERWRILHGQTMEPVDSSAEHGVKSSQ